MKAGDYVRTKEGMIAKYTGINKEYELHLFDNKIQWFYEYYREDIDFEDWDEFIKENVVKSSPNIIDLIEENDYINGLRVEKNKYGELYTSYVYYGGDIGKQCEVYTTWLEDYTEDMIENIVTKEQFERMEYKI